MNRFIRAVTSLDLAAVEDLLKQPKWRSWSEPSGKNALHYLCGIGPVADGDHDLAILKLLLKNGLDIDSIHRIEDKNCGHFPATPLWYAYTRGRNEKLYKHLLKKGADPGNCWWAISWYNDVTAGKLWLKHGAKIDTKPTLDELFWGTFQWKKYDFAKWLISLGADVNATDGDGNTALMMAVKRKDEQSIGWLVSEGGDPYRSNTKGVSARSIAEAKGPKRLLNLF